MGPDGPNWGQEDYFPTNPDLADILGRTDFDFENFYFLDFVGSQLGPNLGPGLGPGLGPAVVTQIAPNGAGGLFFLPMII